MTLSNNNDANIPAPIYFGEEETQVLDYKQIRDTTLESRKKAIETRKIIPKEVILSEKEHGHIQTLIKDMEKHISRCATEGKDRFTYDCHKLESYMHQKLAEQFKDKNPYFYVESHVGTRTIIVEWSGKNEA